MSDSDALGTFSLLMQKNVTVEEAARIAMIGNNEEREKAVFAALFQKEALENLTDEQKEEIRQQMYSSANLGVQNKLRLQQVAILGLSKKARPSWQKRQKW